MDNSGFIVLSRKITEWEWYSDTNTFRVFLHCLLKANWKDGRFQGHDVPRGSFVTSFAKLAEELNMSVRSVRTALSHLEQTGEITRKTTNKWQAITVENYGKYQDYNPKADNQSTINRQSIDNQSTTIEQRNKETKEQERERTPTLNEVRDYIRENKLNVKADTFFAYYQARDWRVGGSLITNWEAQARLWASRENNPIKAGGRNYDIDDLERQLVGKR